MDIKDIRRIIELMKENDLSEFELQEEGYHIVLKRHVDGEPRMMISGPAATPVIMSQHPVAQVAAGGGAVVVDSAATAPGEPPNQNDGLVAITSPMVGTFYRAASPDADSYVAVGSTVDEESAVCIVEAMKVMNEIKAETTGTIRKILVENASPVQFGQTLFLVDPT
jgi:acetyl-CoA carboxylase biotin carboxyl carrier protein